MEITAKMVKDLREATQAGIMECKKALTQANGDFKAAEKLLKEMGLAAVAKRSDRATNEGRVTVLAKGDKFAMVEITCETDFVVKNELFIALGKNVAEKVIDTASTSVEDPVLVGLVNDCIATIHENMKLHKVCLWTVEPGTYVVSYIHGEGNIGTLVKFAIDKAEIAEDADFKALAFNTALQVCSQNPMFLDASKVPADYEAEQIGIFKVQVKDLDKPEKVKEGIVRGKLTKLYSEICLNQQNFDFYDDGLTVEKQLAKYGKEHGCKVAVTDYIRFKAGSND